jgi:ZIP family zinc transporter
MSFLPASFETLSPVVQALLAGVFTWAVTALGAGLVVFTRTVDRRLLDAMLGFAAGVMMAASVWSLLLPAIDYAKQQGGIEWLPALVGLAGGGAFLRLADLAVPHLHLNKGVDEAEGPATSWERATLLVLAITIHNIPEGLAVGVAFGAVAAGAELGEIATLGGAVALALGIGLQNFPEGVAVAMPLRGEGMGRLKSFWYGQLSALVEPVAAVAGAAAVLTLQPALPYALAFAAGAMLYVVVEELIPEAHDHGHEDLATVATLVGFAVMMTLDVALG